MEDHKPRAIVSELESLIQSWGAVPWQSVDRFFPIRFCCQLCLILGAGFWLIFDAHEIAQTLTKDPQNLPRLEKFLFFRGWFLLLVLAIGAYSYLKNWYPATVYSAFLLIGLTNLVFDLFTVYPERLASPNPFFTLFLLVRLTMLWSVFLAVKNASRLPQAKDRINIFLPFRQRTERGAEG
jgi:hypothetical protein